MQTAAANLDFEIAAAVRDQIRRLEADDLGLPSTGPKVAPVKGRAVGGAPGTRTTRFAKAKAARAARRRAVASSLLSHLIRSQCQIRRPVLLVVPTAIALLHTFYRGKVACRLRKLRLCIRHMSILVRGLRRQFVYHQSSIRFVEG